MSNLTVTTLTNQDVQLSKAWVNFNGTGTVAIRSAFNVSSLTDNAVGGWTVNFTNNMPNALYVATSNCHDAGSLENNSRTHSYGVSAYTINAVSDTGLVDRETIISTVFSN